MGHCARSKFVAGNLNVINLQEMRRKREESLNLLRNGISDSQDHSIGRSLSIDDGI